MSPVNHPDKIQIIPREPKAFQVGISSRKYLVRNPIWSVWYWPETELAVCCTDLSLLQGRLWSCLRYSGLIRSTTLELLSPGGQELTPTRLSQVVCLFVCFNNRRRLASFVKCPRSEVSNPNKCSKQNVRERWSVSSADTDVYEFAAFSLLPPFRHMKIFAAILCGTKSKHSSRLSASDESTPLFSFSIFN